MSRVLLVEVHRGGMVCTNPVFDEAACNADLGADSDIYKGVINDDGGENIHLRIRNVTSKAEDTEHNASLCELTSPRMLCTLERERMMMMKVNYHRPLQDSETQVNHNHWLMIVLQHPAMLPPPSPHARRKAKCGQCLIS